MSGNIGLFQGRRLLARIVITGILFSVLFARPVPVANAQGQDAGVVAGTLERSVPHTSALTTVVCPDPKDPADPLSNPNGGDNTYQGATLLVSGIAQTHCLYYIPPADLVPAAADVDWFTFKIGAPTRITLEAMPANPGDPTYMDTVMRLYDSQQQLVTENDDKNLNTWYSYMQRCGTYRLPAGTYYVKLEESNNDNQIPSYKILLKINGSCIANVNFNIAGDPMLSQYLTHGDSIRKSYFEVSGGPAKLTSLEGAFPLIASARIIYSEGTDPDHRSGTPTSYAEVMGYPFNRLSYDYRFPWYDNVNMSSELLLANFGTANITVNVYLGNTTTLLGSYPLTPSQSISVNLPPLDGDPLRVVATSTAARFLAAQRIIYPDSGGNATSYFELNGMPRNQVIANYWIPWYDNVNMSSELHLTGININRTTTVKVYRGTTLLGSYSLAPGTSTQVSYPDLNGGPLHLTSVGGIPFIASERVIYPDGSGNPTSYSELMAIPNGQLANTYWFPSYSYPNSNTVAQLRVSNPNTGATTVQVWLHGTLLNSYPVKAGAFILVDYPGRDNGLLKVRTTDGKRIIVSMPVIQSVAGNPTSYSELAAYPANRLANSYVFPWYNNVNFDTELRIGVP